MQTSPFIAILLALLIGLGLTGCDGADGANPAGDEPDAAGHRAVRVETLVVEPSSFEDVIRLTGTLEAYQDAVLSSEMSGQVLSVRPLGTLVRRGEVVAQFDDRLARAGADQARAQLEAAEAGLALAEDAYRRQEPLLRDSIISPIEFERVRAERNRTRAQRDQATASLDQAMKQLSSTRIVAPFNGTIEQHMVQPGELVNPGNPVVRLININPLKATVGVPERYAGDIRVGTAAVIRVGAGGFERNGRVSFAGSVINPSSRSFPVEIEMENPDAMLKPQMVANIFITREAYEDVLLVPQAAIVRDERGPGVFVVTMRDGLPVASRNSVQLGPSSEGRTLIVQGLNPGDEVVIVGQATLTTGDILEVVNR